MTTDPVLLLEGADANQPGASDAAARSFVVFAPGGSGVVLLQAGDAATPPGEVDMSDAARWDFGKLALNYSVEPGRALFAQASAGSVDLDVLAGGER